MYEAKAAPGVVKINIFLRAGDTACSAFDTLPIMHQKGGGQFFLSLVYLGGAYMETGPGGAAFPANTVIYNAHMLMGNIHLEAIQPDFIN